MTHPWGIVESGDAPKSNPAGDRVPFLDDLNLEARLHQTVSVVFGGISFNR